MDIKLLLGAAALFMYARNKNAFAQSTASTEKQGIAVGEKTSSNTAPLNAQDLNDVEYVDQSELYLEPTNQGVAAKSAAIQAQNERRSLLEKGRKMAELRRLRAEEQAVSMGSYAYGKMLERSIVRKDDLLSAALMQKFQPFQSSSTVRNPMLGFVDGAEEVETKDTDFSIYEAVPAQEFNSHLTARDAYHDYPVVDDDSEKGDFAGVLLQESGAADFSTMIVNEARSDFGREPGYRYQPKRRK